MGAEQVSGAEGRTPMLSREENERLTRVGPGTPMGTLLRRYWFPIAATADLDANPVKAIKLLGEDLVLFRDRRGRPCPLAARSPPPRGGARFRVPPGGRPPGCVPPPGVGGPGRRVAGPAEPSRGDRP